MRKGQTPKKVQLLCNCSTIKAACPSETLTAAQQNNVSYSLCLVFLSPCILHVCPRKCLHYKCDMLANSDAQHSIWYSSSLNSAFHVDLRPQLQHFCKWLAVIPVYYFGWTLVYVRSVQVMGFLAFYHFNFSGTLHVAPRRWFSDYGLEHKWVNSAEFQTK